MASGIQLPLHRKLTAGQLELVIVILTLLGVGFVAVVIALAWPLYVKPKLRKRYEKTHHRRKSSGSQRQ